ncbi:hypothetical protein AIIKEEIJ_06395 [Rhodococcus sp. YH1]|nr:hypothetical protein [Rhodococcus sp. YH1]
MVDRGVPLHARRSRGKTRGCGAVFCHVHESAWTVVCSAAHPGRPVHHRPVPGPARPARRGPDPRGLQPGGPRGRIRDAVPRDGRRGASATGDSRRRRLPRLPGPARPRRRRGRGATVDGRDLHPSARPAARPAHRHHADPARRRALLPLHLHPPPRPRRARRHGDARPQRRAVHGVGARGGTAAARGAEPRANRRTRARLRRQHPAGHRPRALEAAPGGPAATRHARRRLRRPHDAVPTRRCGARRRGDRRRRRVGPRRQLHRRPDRRRRLRRLPGPHDRHHGRRAEPAGLGPHHRAAAPLGGLDLEHRAAAGGRGTGRDRRRPGAARAGGADRGAAAPAVPLRGHAARPARRRRSPGDPQRVRARGEPDDVQPGVRVRRHHRRVQPALHRPGRRPVGERVRRDRRAQHAGGLRGQPAPVRR